MKIKFEKDLKDKEVEDINPTPFKTTSPFGGEVTVDVFINISELFEYYTTEDMSSLFNRLDNILLPDLTEDFKMLGKYQKIDTIKSVSDTSVVEITEKYFEIRTAINSVLEIRRRYVVFKQAWEELITFIKNLCERKKDSVMLQKEVKEYNNQQLRQAKVNEILASLLKQKDRLAIATVRIKHFMDEVEFTLEYLRDVNAEVSRVQSAIALALDTGEISKVQWRN